MFEDYIIIIIITISIFLKYNWFSVSVMERMWNLHRFFCFCLASSFIHSFIHLTIHRIELDACFCFLWFWIILFNRLLFVFVFFYFRSIKSSKITITTISYIWNGILQEWNLNENKNTNQEFCWLSRIFFFFTNPYFFEKKIHQHHFFLHSFIHLFICFHIGTKYWCFRLVIHRRHLIWNFVSIFFFTLLSLLLLIHEFTTCVLSFSFSIPSLSLFDFWFLICNPMNQSIVVEIENVIKSTTTTLNKIMNRDWKNMMKFHHIIYEWIQKRNFP